MRKRRMTTPRARSSLIRQPREDTQITRRQGLISGFIIACILVLVLTSSHALGQSVVNGRGGRLTEVRTFSAALFNGMGVPIVLWSVVALFWLCQRLCSSVIPAADRTRYSIVCGLWLAAFGVFIFGGILLVMGSPPWKGFGHVSRFLVSGGVLAFAVLAWRSGKWLDAIAEKHGIVDTYYTNLRKDAGAGYCAGWGGLAGALLLVRSVISLFWSNWDPIGGWF